MICQMNKVDIENIKNWDKKEDRSDKFKEFEPRLSGKERKRR